MATDLTPAYISSGIFLMLFTLFLLYKNENKYLICLLSYFYKPEKAKLERDTRTEDWVLLIALFIMILILGVKLVTFTVIISDSMKPEFQRGDMVLMQGFFKEPHIGDIITFQADDARYAITHRVYSVGDVIITKGDNIPYPDRYQTTQDKVLLKAITIGDHPIVIPKLGALFITDYSKQGIIFKYGDQFTFMQNLSATIRAWGYIITIIAVLAYIMSMKR